MQVEAFKDFSADEAGGAEASGAEASGAAQQQEEAQPAEQESHEEAEPEEAAGSSGGDYPPHSVQGLPALSPTMSQGLHSALFYRWLWLSPHSLAKMMKCLFSDRFHPKW